MCVCVWLTPSVVVAAYAKCFLNKKSNRRKSFRIVRFQCEDRFLFNSFSFFLFFYFFSNKTSFGILDICATVFLRYKCSINWNHATKNQKVCMQTPNETVDQKRLKSLIGKIAYKSMHTYVCTYMCVDRSIWTYLICGYVYKTVEAISNRCLASDMAPQRRCICTYIIVYIQLLNYHISILWFYCARAGDVAIGN